MCERKRKSKELVSGQAQNASLARAVTAYNLPCAIAYFPANENFRPVESTTSLSLVPRIGGFDM